MDFYTINKRNIAVSDWENYLAMVTGTFQDQASHQASLSRTGVQDAIARGRSLIAGFGERYETNPVGGIGLNAA